ncbi:MAG: 4Fe-4S binding protein [Candidatus Methanoperedens sp.]|nr:4Fe-4S binding protein [Candidatus Methanoperedens sp.]
MKSCCSELEDAAYYQGETKSGEKWIPAFIEYVDKEKCNGCGMCVKVCSRGVYEIRESNGKKISVAVNPGNCVGDGSCHIVCKPNAIKCAPKKM